MHEVTHAIETDLMKKLVMDFASKNQGFINSLEMQNTPESKNIIKQIYESIVRTLNKLTTKGRYRNFVQDLETKWREAYQTQENNLKNTRYSIKTDEKGNKYINVDTDQNVFENIDIKDYNKVAKMYITIICVVKQYCQKMIMQLLIVSLLANIQTLEKNNKILLKK